MKTNLFLFPSFLFLLLAIPACADQPVAFKDIPYVPDGGERQQLDIYLPQDYQAAEKPLPVILLIHGGGWEAGSKNDPAGLAQWFLPHGYAVAAFNYRFLPTDVMPAQIIDCKSAVRWLRAHAAEYHLDTGRFGVWGMSAGGHLVALLGTTGENREFDQGENLDQSSAIQAVCDLCGPTDFEVWWTDDELPRNAWGPEKLFGGSREEKKEMIAKMSPRLQVTKNSAPMLILHAEDDNLVNPRQARLLDEALRNAGVKTDLRVFPAGTGGHGCRHFFDEDAKEFVTAFFDEHLKK